MAPTMTEGFRCKKGRRWETLCHQVYFDQPKKWCRHCLEDEAERLRKKVDELNSTVPRLQRRAERLHDENMRLRADNKGIQTIVLRRWILYLKQSAKDPQRILATVERLEKAISLRQEETEEATRWLQTAALEGDES